MGIQTYFLVSNPKANVISLIYIRLYATAVTSMRFSRCSTQRSCSEPTAQPCMRAHRGRSAVRRPWPRLSRGRARAAQPAIVNGAVGLAWAPHGQPRVAFGFTILRGKIVAIDLVADPERLRQLDLVIL
jgi:hypothetical protein